MGKRHAFWSSLPRSSSGDVNWPADNDERAAMAVDIVGATIVGAVEAALETRLKVVTAVASDVHELNVHRDIFSSMSGKQKTAV